MIDMSIAFCVRRCQLRSIRYALRVFSSKCVSTSHVTVEKETIAPQQWNVASVVLHRPPVNGFDIPFTRHLTKTLKEIENSGVVDAVIIKSALPNVFSAGLDLHELYGVSRGHLEAFWQSVQDLWFQVYSSKLVTLSFINGHCLAAGTIIAAACDYRVACEGDYSIGVTAAKVGLVAPPWFLTMLSHLMGKRRTEHALLTGKTFSPDEAVQVGLVDEICPTKLSDDACLQVLKPYLLVSQESRKTMKKYMRAELIENFNLMRESDMDNFVDYVMKVSVQEQLGSFIQRLKRKQ